MPEPDPDQGEQAPEVQRAEQTLAWLNSLDLRRFRRQPQVRIAIWDARRALSVVIEALRRDRG